jgi:hypothetical protein
MLSHISITNNCDKYFCISFHLLICDIHKLLHIILHKCVDINKNAILN